MQSQQQQPSAFLPLYERGSPPSDAPAKSTKASIWAPQPQPSETTWPRAIEAFGRCIPPSRDDAFAPLEPLGTVGGSGSATPDLRSDSHVEQLLRTLNLNSPELQPAVVATSSPKSSVSSGSRSMSSRGRSKPIPPPLDLSFGSNTSSSVSNFSLSATGGSVSTANTSTDDSSVLSSASYPQPHPLASAAAACPESPRTDTDFSPLSFASSALLTPLDSPHGPAPMSLSGVGVPMHSPARSAHVHNQVPSPARSNSIHHQSPTQALSLHGSPLHSPTQPYALYGNGAKEQQQRFAYSTNGSGNVYTSEPPSPYAFATRGLPFAPSGWSPNGAAPLGQSHGHVHASAPGGRFIPLPPTPPDSMTPAHDLHSLHNSHSHNNLRTTGLFGADAHGRVPSSYLGAGDIDRDWIRGDELRPSTASSLGLGMGGDSGLGLGAGFGHGHAHARSTSLGMAFRRDVGPAAGAATNALGLGVGLGLGMEDLNALRGSLAYHQQQLAQQQRQVEQQQQLLLQQQEAIAQAQAQAQANANVNVNTGLNDVAFPKVAPETRSRRSPDATPVTVTASPTSSAGGYGREGRSGGGNEPINFLSLLHPSSSPPYATFVSRIIKSADQQASIFLQQKLKVAGVEERARIVDAICARGAEMMMHRFGNWAVQRCLEAATGAEERRKIVGCMRGRVVDLATNCYGCHVLQKALDCEEEEVRLLIVSELLMGDPAQTLVNKHASHVWSKIMELSWTPPAPPIFAYVNKSLKGKWASLACHETGSLVVQHAFENLEDEAKDGIVHELLGNGPAVFAEVAKNQWGSYCIQHILEHGSEKHRQMALDHLLAGLLEFAANEQGSKSVVKALKEGGKETLDRVVKRMCEPAKGARRAMIVDLALSLTGSQLIASVLPNADKEQRAALYDCIRGHIVTLRGCKTGSKVIWLFDRMRAYYGY
ncbi:ARM repeat-containing protein [Mycena kentingensis (nom. inval.)]|nr:ARM repeat-containing protein [Mycena kentingensis (nom. inval.)]